MMLRAMHGDGWMATDEFEEGDKILFPYPFADGFGHFQSIFLVATVADKMACCATTIGWKIPLTITAGELTNICKIVEFCSADHAAFRFFLLCIATSVCRLAAACFHGRDICLWRAAGVFHLNIGDSSLFI